MPFQYEHYRSPYVGTMADLLTHQHDARARAAEISGQAYGGAIANIGQTIAQLPGQIAQTKRLAQQDELGALQVGEERRTVAARNAFARIIQDTPQLDEDGVSLYDIPAVGKQLAALGFDPGGAVEHLGKINDAFRAEQTAKRALVVRGAEGIIAAGNDPTLAGHFLDQLERNGSYPAAKIDQFRQFIAADPANVAKVTAMLVGKQELATAAPGATIYNKGTGATVSTVPDPKGDAATAHAAAQQAETARHNQETERISGLTAGRAEAAQKETARHNHAVEAFEQKKLTQTAGDKTDLTPEGLDAAAQMFAKTGQLPALGMGDKTTRKAIINRAAVMVPGLDVASAKADFNANSESLKTIQKQRDAIGAFEQTASKNIDVFLAAAGKVVDTGSPLSNSVARLVSGKMLGSPDQAAYDAARQVAINEIAKITSNPTLSGTLSDSARHEVDAFNPASATLKQTVAVMRLLKNDMANRTTALDDQIAAISARIKLGSAKPPAGADAADPLGLFGPKKP